MLKEKKHDPQPNRRWFFDDFFDLIVWHDDERLVTGFQLCYDTQGTEHALTWKAGKGIEHHQIDSGEESPIKNRTPVLIPDGTIPRDKLVREFTSRAGSLEPAIYNLVLQHLRSEGR